MKIDLSKKEIEIVKKSLRNRVEDLTRYADKCASQNQRTAENELLEMANDCDAVLEKFNDLDRG